MGRIAALLTAYNRKNKTIKALETLFSQVLPAGMKISVYLVDDGSSDGTSTLVAEKFPQVKLLQGTGSLYWCGGMRLAFGEAMKESYDYYLWLNDDTSLFRGALAAILDTSARLGETAIVVGSMQDPETGQMTYGGVRRLHRWRPLKFTLIAPGEIPIAVGTMNGNFVLIPQAVAQKVGNLDQAFTHGIGDIDYGLRAGRLGIEIYITAGYCGTCQHNPPENKELPFSVRWKKMFSPHGLPPREWAIFARRYAGPFWLIYWASPYIHMIINGHKNKRFCI